MLMKKLLILFVCLTCYCSLHAQNTFLDSLQLKQMIYNGCTAVKDQYNSSTCWSFAGNSFIESELIKKKIDKLDLSEMFIARYSYLRKINRHLALKGTNFFTPGGQFHDIQWVIKEYGMMPEEAYSGKPNGEVHHDHAMLDTVIKHFIEKALVQKKEKLTAADLTYVNQQLDKYLGKVPATFLYKGKRYTPKTFAKDYLHFNADDYVEITSYTHHLFYTSFVLEDQYNWTGDKYLNVPVDEFKEIIDDALTMGYTVVWDGDTQEPGFDYSNGVAYLPYDVPDLQTERQSTFEDKTTAIDHMMHIVGLSTDKEGNTWYYIKNSWGESNSLGGYLYMQDKYLFLKTGAVIVNKAAMIKEIKDKLRL
jgi:bleomycin hydrolase